MPNPILFTNSFIQFEDDETEYRIMYMYKEHFFLEFSETEISTIPVTMIDDEIVEQVLSNEENYEEVKDDSRLIELLDASLEAIKNNQKDRTDEAK